MYTQNTAFISAFIQQLDVLTLQKSDCDLFLILQANTITYQQLYMTGIHGTTITASRLSLKRLESNGYLISKSLGYYNNVKYYYLSTKGKERIRQIVPSVFLEQIEADFERRPPTTQQQIPHRISTNDFFYCYLSSPYAVPVIWKLEKGISLTKTAQIPRSDGFLRTATNNYFVEQDNGTQSDAVLQNKLNQYLNSEFFQKKQLQQNALVFSLNIEIKPQRIGKPSYSIYRILLKSLKVWKLLSQKPVELPCLSAFISYIKNVPASESFITAADQRLLESLANRYPELTYQKTEQLKKHYLHKSNERNKKQELQDCLFWKRVKQKFYPLPALHRYLQGMHVYVIPNHRMDQTIPFVMWNEYQIPDYLLQCLFYAGILPHEWTYMDCHELHTDQHTFFFRGCFCSNTTTCIVCEDVANDLGGRERIRFFLKKQYLSFPVVLVLLVNQAEDAFLFLEENKQYITYPENQNIILCFLNKPPSLTQSPEKSTIYEGKRQGDTWTICNILLEYESLTGNVQVMERGR